MKISQERYTLDRNHPYIPLYPAADHLKVTAQRLSRYLISKKIPVVRVGYLVLIHEDKLDDIKKGLGGENEKPTKIIKKVKKTAAKKK